MKHIPVFLVAAEEEHFQRAADQLNLAQSAVSRRVQALEAALGTPLFDRRAGGVRLTTAGRVLRDHARRITSAVDLAGEHTRRAAAGYAGILNVSFIEMAMRAPVIAARLRTFMTGLGDVSARFHSLLSEAQLVEIEAGRIDVGLLLDEGKRPAGLQFRELLALDMLAALPADHPLAARDRVALADLAHYALIWPSRSVMPVINEQIVAEFGRRGVQPQIVMEASTSETSMSLVASGIGVGFVDGMQRDRAPAGVTLRPVEGFDGLLRVSAAWKRDDTSPVLARFLSIIFDSQS